MLLNTSKFEALPECKCEHTRLSRRIVKGGAVVYQWQCQECFRGIGGFVSKKVVEGKKLSYIPAFDDNGHDTYLNNREKHYKKQRDKVEAEAEEKSREWWVWYNNYLKTDEWRTKRQAVMYRSRGVCECCLLRSATQVHHLSYSNVGHEFLPELAATCERCHKKAHGDSE